MLVGVVDDGDGGAEDDHDDGADGRHHDRHEHEVDGIAVLISTLTQAVRMVVVVAVPFMMMGRW